MNMPSHVHAVLRAKKESSPAFDPERQSTRLFPRERSSLSDELARKDSAKLTWIHERPFPRRMFRRTDADSCDVRCYAARPPGTVDHSHRRAGHVESIRGYRSSDSRGEDGLVAARDDHPGAWPRPTLSALRSRRAVPR